MTVLLKLQFEISKNRVSLLHVMPQDTEQSGAGTHAAEGNGKGVQSQCLPREHKSVNSRDDRTSPVLKSTMVTSVY